MATVRIAPTNTTTTGLAIGMAWQSYLQKLQTNPLMTKAITSGVISVVSDLLARALAKKPLKSSTAINELTIGLVIRGPVLHYFHTFLDKVIFSRFNQNSALVVLAKLIIDQALFAPLFTSLYFYLIALMKDEKLKSTTRKLQYELWPIMKSNWTVWIPANFVGYYLVPLDLRVLWNNIVGLFWTAYLIGRVADGPQTRRN